MGAEQIFPINTILKRRTPQGDEWDEVRVVGTGNDLIVTSNTTFSPSKALNVQEAREDYDGDFADEYEDGEEGRVILVNPGPTPEQVFAKQTRADREAGIEPQGRPGRKRSDPPAPVRKGGE